MTKYIHVGTQALEFPDLRVECSSSGTPFEYDLDPTREALLIAQGVIARPADRRAAPAMTEDSEPDTGHHSRKGR